MWNRLVQTIVNRLVATDRIARNLSRPESGIFGAITSYLLKRVNQPVERNAVKHLDVRPNHTVLEIGFGLGYGIQHVLDIIKEGDGSVHGLDISDEMVRRTTRRFQKEIKDKKVNICIGDVACMPYEDNTFDRVFHTNSYYFWPDMDKAAKEIYRVMRKDGVMVTALVPDKTPDTLSCLAHPMLPNRFITRYDVNTTMVDCSISCGFAVPSQESSQRDRGHF
ncbi:uncharacterized methyltransferase YdaC-like isoform X2 [Lineus longissimus]|uniref:uncharacterized methyltransferase YdaC-like isoform X2 n=1 Tax=Lineus longissimus TaxID=88925 RepID=UPI00315D2B86